LQPDRPVECRGHHTEQPVHAVMSGPRISRRAALTGALGAVVGVGAGVGIVAIADDREPTVARSGAPDEALASGRSPVVSGGVHQAGIDRPATPQRNGLVSVLTVADPKNLGFLAALGARIRGITDPARPDLELTPDGAGDLTITVGLGPRVVAAIDPTLPGAT